MQVLWSLRKCVYLVQVESFFIISPLNFRTLAILTPNIFCEFVNGEIKLGVLRILVPPNPKHQTSDISWWNCLYLFILLIGSISPRAAYIVFYIENTIPPEELNDTEVAAQLPFETHSAAPSKEWEAHSKPEFNILYFWTEWENVSCRPFLVQRIQKNLTWEASAITV